MHSDLNFVTALVRLILERAHASILCVRVSIFFFFFCFVVCRAAMRSVREWKGNNENSPCLIFFFFLISCAPARWGLIHGQSSAARIIVRSLPV